MTKSSKNTTSSHAAWETMIEKYLALNGVVENVCFKPGASGNGIFPIDPLQPVKLNTPRNLLFPVAAIEFTSGSPRIKEDAALVGDKEREFFALYQDTFSWGAAGGRDCAAFINAMDELPAEIKSILADDLGLNILFKGSVEERTRQMFLKSRMIHIQGKPVIMPVIELINHSPQGVQYLFKNGISFEGTFAGEVLAHYGRTDPLGVLAGWGFLSAEPRAFSLPMQLPMTSGRLKIRRNFNESAKHAGIQMPLMNKNEKETALSYLLLGHKDHPRLPKSVFYHLMHMQGVNSMEAEELFDRIQHFNRMRFQKLSVALDKHQGTTIDLFRGMVKNQLQALSCYMGVKKL